MKSLAGLVAGLVVVGLAGCSPGKPPGAGSENKSQPKPQASAQTAATSATTTPTSATAPTSTIAPATGPAITVTPAPATVPTVTSPAPATTTPTPSAPAPAAPATTPPAPPAPTSPSPATTTPAPAPAAAVVDHLLLSEIATGPTGAEFIEIHNPTTAPIVLSNYFLTDGHKPTAQRPQLYCNIVTGQNYGSGLASPYDFHVRFPPGASIAAGEFQTIALDSDGFELEYPGDTPTYEILQDGAADGVPDMLPVGPGAIGIQAGLSNSKETVVLYTWDGQAPRVSDVDYVCYGLDPSRAVDKSKVAGYAPETSPASQRLVDRAAPYSTITRYRFDEPGEVTSSGNGVTGHDETSEDQASAWDPATSPSPNAP